MSLFVLKASYIMLQLYIGYLAYISYVVNDRLRNYFEMKIDTKMPKL